MKYTEPRILARRVVVALESARIDVSTEAAAHTAITQTLASQKMDVRQEVNLGDHGRIDLLIDNVGVEVKIGGRRRETFSQLFRYLDSPDIGALVLATSAAWPNMAVERLRQSGKPVYVASLTRGWL